MYFEALEDEFPSDGPRQMVMNALLECTEFFADCQAIKISGIGTKPRQISQETMSRTLHFIYKYRGPEVFEDLSTSTFFSTMFTYLYSRTKRQHQKYMNHEDFFRLYKKYPKLQKGVLRRYQRSLYIAAAVVDAVDEIGCMYEDCPDRNRMEFLKGVKKENWTGSDMRLIKRFGNDLKICSAWVSRFSSSPSVSDDSLLGVVRWHTARERARKMIGRVTSCLSVKSARRNSR